jgi:peptidoglycan/xylan/chitin deacetylase (PgdA/CDA1 family)
MYRTFKCAVLYVAKYSGLFHLARLLTARGLRILCYHGLSLGDEHRFRTGLFMRPEVLSRRIRTLREHRFPVISLEAGLEGMERGDLPEGATVVTFDDGFYSNYAEGLAILRQLEIPATIYVTTYYVEQGRPIFGLVVQYLFWKTRRTVLDLGGLGLDRDEAVDLPRSHHDRNKLALRIIEFAESRFDKGRRDWLSRELAARLEVSYEELLRNRSLSLMTPDEIRETAAAGVSIQLHTHRHRLPVEEHSVRREIEDNRASLEAILGLAANHFCYPSGLWSQAQWPWLAAAGVRSAVTCDPGLNDAATPRLGLKRFLDADDLSQIEFEAEIYGFGEILRRFFRGRRARPRPNSRLGPVPAGPTKDGPGREREALGSERGPSRPDPVVPL